MQPPVACGCNLCTYKNYTLLVKWGGPLCNHGHECSRSSKVFLYRSKLHTLRGPMIRYTSPKFELEKAARNQTEFLQNLLLCVSGHGERRCMHWSCAATEVWTTTCGIIATILNPMILVYSTTDRMSQFAIQHKITFIQYNVVFLIVWRSVSQNYLHNNSKIGVQISTLAYTLHYWQWVTV